MRFLITAPPCKFDANATGKQFDEQLFAAYMQYNEDMTRAGVLIAAEGLRPGGVHLRIAFARGDSTVLDGPFTETKELIAGFWLWQVKSKDEAIEWVKRCPNPTGAESEIEIRQVFEASDFGPEFTPELRDQEQRALDETARPHQTKGKPEPR